MINFTKDELEKSYHTLLSMLNKFEKSHAKLTKETWQCNFVESAISAIKAILPIIKTPTNKPTENDWGKVSGTLSLILEKTENVRQKLKPNSPQWTLNKNRIQALKIVISLINTKREKHDL
jgi:isocitrate dehydrogenase